MEGYKENQWRDSPKKQGKDVNKGRNMKKVSRNVASAMKISKPKVDSKNDKSIDIFEEEECVSDQLRRLGLINDQGSKRRDINYGMEPNKELLHQKLEVVAKEKAQELMDEESKGGQKSWDPTGVEIKPSDMEFCLKHTNFTSDQIENWFQGFRVECPNGRLTKNHLHSLFCKLLPGEDSEAFCNHIFRIFDSDGNNFLDFKEFLMALDVSSLRSEREKLEWAFRLYDSDYSGSINLKEIKAVMETFSALGGIDSGSSDGVSEELSALAKMPPEERAEYIFDILDVDNDGEVSLEEFVEGYMKIKNGDDELIDE